MHKNILRIDHINPLVMALALFMAYLLLLLSTYNRTDAARDMAEYLNNPLRVIHGQLPYRDFWLLFPPGEVFLPAFIYKVFGLNINNLLVFFGVIWALIGLFSFLLGKVIFKDNFFAMVASILAFFLGPKSYYLPLTMAAVFFLKYLKRERGPTLFLAGLLVGVAFLFDIYVVVAVFLAYLVTLFLYARLRRTPRYLLKSLAIFSSGGIFVIGITLVALREIWPIMVKEVVIESLSHGSSMNLPYFYDVGGYLKTFVNAFKGLAETGSICYFTDFFIQLSLLLNVTISYLLPFLMVGIIVFYLIGQSLARDDKITVSFFSLWALSTLPKGLGRADIGHLQFCLTPLFFLLVFFWQKNLEKPAEGRLFRDKFLNRGFGLVVGLLLLALPLFLYQTIYALIVPHYEVATPYGRLLLGNEAEAGELNKVIDFIHKNTIGGDYIFVTPWFSPPLYALTNRKNPTYYDSLIDLMVRPSAEKQIRVSQDLLSKDTKLIIHQADWGFDNKKERHFLTTCPILQKCIEDKFELVEKYGLYEIYVPKER